MSALEVMKTMDTTDDAKNCLDKDNVNDIFNVIFIHVNEELFGGNAVGSMHSCTVRTTAVHIPFSLNYTQL